MDARRNLITYAAGRLTTLLLLILLFASMAVPASAAPTAQSSTQRIRFAPGATSAVVSGSVNGGSVRRYVLTALAGQTMTIEPTSYGAPISVTIFDTGRGVLGSVVSGEAWSGRLPSTGDYTLVVYPSPYTANTAFQLRVEIVFGSQQPSPMPERIRFAPGAVSAQVTGYLPSAASKVYVLDARAGQVMTIESWSGTGPFRYTVTDPNGNVLGAANQGERWSGTLPRNGDYRVTLQSPADAPPANYWLRITIVNAAPSPTATPKPTATPTPAPPTSAERIRFPQGATSVTLRGYVDTYTSARFVLRALRGQTMTVALDTFYGNATRVTVRDERGNFLGSADNGERWSGYLPATGDYYVEVYAPGENIGDNYWLWIEIR